MRFRKYILCCLIILIFVSQTGCALKASGPVAANGEKSILEKATMQDEAGAVWKIQNRKMKDALWGVSRIEIFQGDLLFIGYTDMYLVSMETGEILHKMNYEAYELPIVSVCGDKIVVNGWQDGDIKVLDGEFQVIQEYTLDDSYDGVYVNGDATKAYCFHTDGRLGLLDLATGQEEILSMSVNAPMYMFEDDAIIFDYLNEQRNVIGNGVLDLESTTIKEYPFSKTISGLKNKGNYWLACDIEEWNSYYFSTSEANYSFTLPDEESELSLLEGPASIFRKYVSEEGDSSMTLYDKSGNMLSQYVMDEGWLNTGLVWSEEAGGYFFIQEHWNFFGTTSNLMFWDVDVPMEGENIAFNLEYSFGGNIYTDGLQTCYNKAAEIAQKYGVDIKVGEQCATTYLNDYTMAQETNPFKIHSALRSLDKVLGKYPQGFLGQLTYGKQQRIEISLIGEIIDKEGSAYGGTSGFASRKTEGKNVMVVDINNNGLEQTFYHEIMHLIDYRFEYYEQVKKPKVNQPTQWYKLNPEGYTYTEDYNQKKDDATLAAYANWFVDDYAYVSIKEDRARIMENAMAGNVDVFKDKPQLIAKLEFLCRVIREDFDTTGWPEKTPWEETLEKCR